MSTYHKNPKTTQSSLSRLIQFFMGLLGTKSAMEKKILRNTYSKQSASISKSMLTKFDIEVDEQMGRTVWTLSPKNTLNNTVFLFLHGGAYYANITTLHWQLIEQLISSTNATFVVPDYPLAPESSCKDTYEYLDKVYTKLIHDYHSNPIKFMGDSSGGGLALGFAQSIKKRYIKHPEQIILFSPWLDVRMTNPDIIKFDKRDKLLNINGLKIAGEKYAGFLSLTDYRVSPIYGDLTNLGRISIFVGTNEILLADARKLKSILEEQQTDFDYFEYPEMFHDWVIVPYLTETKEVIRWFTNECSPAKR